MDTFYMNPSENFEGEFSWTLFSWILVVILGLDSRGHWRWILVDIFWVNFCGHSRDEISWTLRVNFHGPYWKPFLQKKILEILNDTNKETSKKNLIKVAFSRKGSWKYTLFQFFINFFLQIFDGACDWLKVEIWIQIQPITSSVKNSEEKLMKIWKSVYFYKPFREKATFTWIKIVDRESEFVVNRFEMK